MQHLSSKLRAMTWGTSKTLHQSWRRNRRRVHIVFYAEQTDNCLSEFDKCFPDFALLEPVATFMYYAFQEDGAVESHTSEIAMVFHLNLRFWHYKLTLSWSPSVDSTHRGKVLKHEGMCYLWMHYDHLLEAGYQQLQSRTVQPWLIPFSASRQSKVMNINVQNELYCAIRLGTPALKLVGNTLWLNLHQEPNGKKVKVAVESSCWV